MHIIIYILIRTVSTRAQKGLYFLPCVRACCGTLLLLPGCGLEACWLHHSAVLCVYFSKTPKIIHSCSCKC